MSSKGARAEKVLCPGLQVDRGVVPSAVVVLGGRPGPRWHTAVPNTSTQSNSNWNQPLDGKTNSTPVLHSHEE